MSKATKTHSLHVRLADDVHRKFKKLCIDKHTTTSAKICNWINQFLRAQESSLITGINLDGEKYFVFLEDSIKNGRPVYIVDKPLIEYAKLCSMLCLERYWAGEGSHYSENERKNMLLGIVGQKIFQLLLDKIEVPYVQNDPLIDQRREKDYDFIIQNLGKIEVKTVDHYAQKALIKESEWHHSDYVVAFQNMKDDNVHFIGWLSGKSVDSYPVTPKGQTKFNPHSDSRIIDVSELEIPETFMEKLDVVHEQIWKR